MKKINNLINKMFPEFEIEIGALIREIHKVSYTYIDIIQGIDLKVSFQENALHSASILLACEYNDDQELKELTYVIEYMKKQIELENKEERMKEIQTALKEDGIEMSYNCTMDIVIGSGSQIKHLFPL
jgi:CRISPR/Cas system Type II protein with McrA/HNH and RuvC-like nuclease domain